MNSKPTLLQRLKAFLFGMTYYFYPDARNIHHFHKITGVRRYTVTPIAGTFTLTLRFTGNFGRVLAELSWKGEAPMLTTAPIQKLYTNSKMTDNDKSWGPFTWGPWHKSISIKWSSNGGEEEDDRNSLRIVAFGWALRIWLPKILEPWKEERPSYANPKDTVVRYWPREYGITLSDMGNGYDFLQIHLGAQTHDSSTTKSWCTRLPWKQWDCVRHSLYLPDGTHFYTEPPRPKRDFFELIRKRDKMPKSYFGFEDYDGEMIIASCAIEEREWHRGVRWFTWLKYFWPAKIRRDLNLEFDHEVGPEKGSWKGGTTGHGIDMLPGEQPVDAFKRYCQMEHERKGRKFKLRFIGPSGPPEAKEIRVARARGWKQCEYPHKIAKDMWSHPDALPCQDGKYISTEEMLEFIKAEQDAQNAQCGMNIKADAT